MARFEINNIECTNLCDYNLPTNTDRTKYGFDELDVLNLQWTSAAGKTYQIAKAADATKIGTLYGKYVPAADAATLKEPNTYTGDVASREAGEEDDIQAGVNKVWSWNVYPTSFSGMTVGLKAHAYDYSLQEAGQNLTLTVTGLSHTAVNGPVDNAFDAAHIYQLNLAFTEENVKDQDALCVKVNVTVTPWTINTVYPVFGK